MTEQARRDGIGADLGREHAQLTPEDKMQVEGKTG